MIHDWFMELSVLEQLTFIIFVLLIIYIIFFRVRFLVFACKKQKSQIETKHFPGVSVIICANNEQHNLEKHLPLILTQSYPLYEVILVDDNSDDETFFVARMLQSQYPHLRIIRLQQPIKAYRGKKFALSIGIKEAAHDIILLIDADCYPATNCWIERMVSSFSNPAKEIVLGYGAYERRKGLLDKLIRFNTMNIALQYMSFAYAGIPYMGVGRNLAYRKECFFRHNGFIKHMHLQSGDDDLFVQQASHKKNVALELSPESFTYSHPARSFRHWFIQKRRHLTTSKYYPTGIKIMLALYPLLLFAFYIFAIAAFVFTNNFLYLLTLLFMVMGNFMLWWKITRIFREKRLFLFSPLLELVDYCITFVLLITGKKSKRARWKHSTI